MSPIALDVGQTLTDCTISGWGKTYGGFLNIHFFISLLDQVAVPYCHTCYRERPPASSHNLTVLALSETTSTMATSALMKMAKLVFAQ